MQLEIGETHRLRATATYDNANPSELTDVSWRSSAPEILSIDSEGSVTAHAQGTANVTATHSSGLSGVSHITIAGPAPSPAPTPSVGLTNIDGEAWNETAVRRVLHLFAFGGLTTDAQIRQWADMEPADAIREMLTFDYTNPSLSPAQDATAQHVDSLASLQAFWSGASADNPMRWDHRRLYATLVTTSTGTTYFISPENLQRTWIRAVGSRGVNPFLHRVAFFLTDYQLSVRASLAGNSLSRAYYDQILQDLAAGRSMTAIINDAARSAAVAARYVHRNNVFFASTRSFQGNDDFAREYFQLFFRVLGTSEDPRYHEDVTIRNNARLLTGMQVDRVPNAFGSTHHGDWAVAPLRFDDHTDASGNRVLNSSRHHRDCLEILHRTICGQTAAEKLEALSPIVARHPEALANLPVFIVEHFADDRLTEDKIAAIRAGWLAADENLLEFLRSYAISTTLHRNDTVKFASTFTRNLTLSAKTVLDNVEALTAQEVDYPRRALRDQGGEVFEPVHDVFGAQTGLEASVSSSLFKSAFAEAVDTQRGIGLLSTEYPVDATGSSRMRWQKDWRLASPPESGVGYEVRTLADWLWERLLSDGGRNFDRVARAQVYALLATGKDFGLLVTERLPAISADPANVYSSVQLSGDARLSALVEELAASSIDLGSVDAALRREANRRMNLAAAFISMMPYSFALEGA